MARRYYSSVAQRTTLASDLDNSSATVVVAAVSGFPSSFPYTLIIDQDTVNEEIVTVTARSGTTLTVTRGVDGTSGVAHSTGAIVNHGVSARDFDEPNAFINGTGVVTETMLAADSVVSGKIADGTIVNADVSASAAIAQSKIADLTTDLAAKVATPSGGTDGQVLVKSGGSVVWGTGGLPYYVGPTAPSSPTAFFQWLDTALSPTILWKMWNGAKWVVVNTSSTSLIPNVGDAAYEGYMAGIVDTTRSGSVVGTDYYQSGAKYLLIIAPKSLEYTTGLRWKSTNDAGPAQTRTRWNGLGATEAMKNAGTNYEAGTYCYDLSYNTTDGGSRWYLPALDELEILYRAFKPTTESNSTSFWTSGAGSFPYNGGTVPFGYNISSDPTGSNYSSGSPAQTSLTAFKSGGAQAFEGSTNPYYWASSEYDASGGWVQGVGGTSAGFQNYNNKNSTDKRVRPVRRVVL